LERAGQFLLCAVELDKELRLKHSELHLNWIVSAWSRSGRHDAPARAAALLEAFQSKARRVYERKSCLRLMKKMQIPSCQ
jgi:hypothetical protein